MMIFLSLGCIDKISGKKTVSSQAYASAIVTVSVFVTHVFSNM